MTEQDSDNVVPFKPRAGGERNSPSETPGHVLSGQFSRHHAGQNEVPRTGPPNNDALIQEIKKRKSDQAEALESYEFARKFLRENDAQLRGEIAGARGRGDARLWILNPDSEEGHACVLSDLFRSIEYGWRPKAIQAAVTEWLQQSGRIPSLQIEQDGKIYLDFGKKGPIPRDRF